ncbi:MAG: integrin alpha [Candidatus Eisenbacteria bacterium]|nr:integrin alpha [Candidatus Eisenbacteria bacterium]
MAGAGDVNGDGFSDVIVGAFLYGNGEAGEGRAFVYHGSPAGLGLTAAWTAESDQVGARFGSSVASAGDVNGDGFSDVIVGAYLYTNGQSDEGRVYAYQGSAAGLATTPAWTAESNQASAKMGISVAAAGDVNGDGFSDVIAGARDYDNGQTDEGRSFVYYGNGGPGRRTLPRQQRTDAATTIALLGCSDSETQFRIRAVMLSVYGRTRLQMEQEVKPRGVVFDGLNTVSGNPFDIGSDGEISFNRLVSGLNAGTQYHWRVRAKYDLAKSPFQRNGPWLQIPVNGWNETDLSTAGGTASAAQSSGIERETLFDLLPAGANPARGPCEVMLSLSQKALIQAEVVDVFGRRVAILVENAVYEEGSHILRWDGRGEHDSNAAAGVYFIRVRSGVDVGVRKVILMR